MVDLSQLSRDEKEQLAAQLAYELRGSSNISVSSGETEFWSSLGEALKLSPTRHGSVAGFVEAYGKKKFREAAQVAQAYVVEGARGRKLVPGQRMAVMRVALGCLVDHLRIRNIPATAGVVCNSMAILHDAVEARFPGYHEAGLLDRVALQPA